MKAGNRLFSARLSAGVLASFVCGCASGDAPELTVSVVGAGVVTDEVTIVVEVTDDKGCEDLALGAGSGPRLKPGKNELVYRTDELELEKGSDFQAAVTLAVSCNDADLEALRETIEFPVVPATKVGDVAELGFATIKAELYGALVGCSPQGKLRALSSFGEADFDVPCGDDTVVVAHDVGAGGAVAINGDGSATEATYVLLRQETPSLMAVLPVPPGAAYVPDLGVALREQNGETVMQRLSYSDGWTVDEGLVGSSSDYPISDFAGMASDQPYFVSDAGERYVDAAQRRPWGVARKPGSRVRTGPSGQGDWMQLETEAGELVVLFDSGSIEEAFRESIREVREVPGAYFAAFVTLQDGSTVFARGSGVTPLAPPGVEVTAGNDSHWVGTRDGDRVVGLGDTFAVFRNGLLDGASFLIAPPSPPSFFESSSEEHVVRDGKLMSVNLPGLIEISVP